MPTIFKWFFKILGVIILLIIIILIFGIILAIKDGNSNEVYKDPSVITMEEYGEEYPYTIDNIKIKCEDDAVWVEDSALNKYGLNGLAENKLKNRKDYKGYTNPNNILIEGKTDSWVLNKGFELCK